MKKIITFILFILASFSVFSKTDIFKEERIEAMASHGSDLTITAVGLALGAAEANPLGVLVIPAKVIAFNKIKNLPLEEQPDAWDSYSSFGWGFTTNNVCVVIGLLSGGASNPLCLGLGAIAGYSRWKLGEESRNKERFFLLCEKQKSLNKDLVCTWNE